MCVVFVENNTNEIKFIAVDYLKLKNIVYICRKFTIMFNDLPSKVIKWSIAVILVMYALGMLFTSITSLLHL